MEAPVKESFWTRAASNRRRTVWLFLSFYALCAAVAWAIYHLEPNLWVVGIAVGFALVNTVVALKFDNQLVSAVVPWRKATPQEYQVLNNVVREVAVAAVLPTPEVYVIDSPALNAFAMGGGIKRNGERDPGKICFTRAMLEVLDREELKAVAAHEMAHIANEDTRLMTRAFALTYVLMVLVDLSMRLGLGNSKRRSRNDETNGVLTLIALAVLILAPLLARLITMAVSRTREYLADTEAARLTRNPKALASALRKIAQNPTVDAPASTAAFFIANPLNAESFLNNLFSTHPPIEKRIEALDKMAV